MLDWRKAVSDLGEDYVCEVHIVSVRNECKELLIVLQKPSDNVQEQKQKTLFCVNDQQLFTVQSPSLLDSSNGVLSPSPSGATGVFRAATECGCGPTKGSESPFATVSNLGWGSLPLYWRGLVGLSMSPMLR